MWNFAGDSRHYSFSFIYRAPAVHVPGPVDETNLEPLLGSLQASGADHQQCPGDEGYGHKASQVRGQREGCVRGRGSQGRWHWICWGLSHQFTRSALGMIQPLRSLHDAGRCGINPPSHTVLPTSVSCKDEGDPCYFSGLCTGASGNHLSPGLGSPQGQSSGDGHPAAMWQVTASPWHPDGS